MSHPVGPDKLLCFHDRRTGYEFTMTVPPTSAWYPLLPPQQIVEIRPTDGTGPRE